MPVDLNPTTAVSVNPVETVVVLLATPDDSAYRRLEAIFAHSKWVLRRARHWGEMHDHLESSPIPVVVTEEVFDGVQWREIWDRIRGRQDVPSRFIVASRLADDPLWQEVLAEGGYNVLTQPFDDREVYWVIGRAWLDWKNARATLCRKAMTPGREPGVMVAVA